MRRELVQAGEGSQPLKTSKAKLTKTMSDLEVDAALRRAVEQRSLRGLLA